MLVAESLTNRQIADQLFRCERVIDNHHVQHCYSKLGIHNRVELTRWVIERCPLSGEKEGEGASLKTRR